MTVFTQKHWTKENFYYSERDGKIDLNYLVVLNDFMTDRNGTDTEGMKLTADALNCSDLWGRYKEQYSPWKEMFSTAGSKYDGHTYRIHKPSKFVCDNAT